MTVLSPNPAAMSCFAVIERVACPVQRTLSKFSGEVYLTRVFIEILGYAPGVIRQNAEMFH